jgi:type IV pilus assembly protein PilW
MTYRRQLGLSLIELMVAMLISSFLILGVTQIFIDNKRNYLYQQSQGENQENGRFTLKLLENELSKTGFRRNPSDNVLYAFPAGTYGSCTFSAGQMIKKVNDTTLCLRFQPRDQHELDCSGAPPSSLTSLDIPYKSTTAMLSEKIEVTGGALKCNDVTIIDSGLAGMQLNFGVGPTDERQVTSFTNNPASDTIRNVRFSVLLSSPQSNVSQGLASKVCTDWQAMTGAAESPCTDDKIYQIVSSSMTLRNLMP